MYEGSKVNQFTEHLFRSLWIPQSSSKCKFGFHLAADGATPFFPGGIFVGVYGQKIERKLKTRHQNAWTFSPGIFVGFYAHNSDRKSKTRRPSKRVAAGPPRRAPIRCRFGFLFAVGRRRQV